ncbi:MULTISPECIES: hypothetical protein [unclassified Sinorhizobium]|uniref:hypothetical protein n=1 Tax=unclassified Sinorhizobium TaxID=2613772 RepID=UPI0035261A3A
MWTILIGALLVICGVLYTMREALGRRRLSEPHRSPESGGAPTLEPPQQGLAFLGLTRNWPGLAMIAVGAILLIFGAYL